MVRLLCIELFCVVTLQYQILVRIAIAYFIIEKKNAVNTKKKQFVKICFYELFVFLVSSANLNLSIRIINQNLFATTATISFTMRDSA